MSRSSPHGLRLRLYVAGAAPNSVAAKQNLLALLEELGQRADLEVIDVLTDPKRGLRDGILITPTLIKVTPAPEARVVGNLRDRKVLLAALDLDPGPR
jgi:circadian clock protein KaiB